MFKNYQIAEKTVNGVKIHYRYGGSGAPLLLLHGYPQTHVMWHAVADELARHFTVIAPDLRGYGDSDKPPADDAHVNHSKRMMAQDIVELMAALDFDTFAILAHDRGARVSHRLALDHPTTVERMVLLDIAPTLTMYEQTDEAFARAYWHWFFLIQPAPLPELLIESHPEAFLDRVLGGLQTDAAAFAPDAVAEYLRCLQQSGAARGICEDYRAAASIDLQHDRQSLADGQRIGCPLLVLWGANNVLGKHFDTLAAWQAIADNVQGKALPCGHFIPEEVPALLLAEALPFLLTTNDEETKDV